MKKKIVIAGGTGFIGTYLHKKFSEENYKVLVISRTKGDIDWQHEDELIEALEGAETLINLAGKSVDCRYNKINREKIFNSRIETTAKLQSLVDRCAIPPKVWINSSTATIYRHAEDRPMDEATGEIGTGFSVEVAKAWERTFFEKQCGNIRKVALRLAITLGKHGGVMTPFTNLVKFGLGGTQGNGKQMFSWIHIEDLYQIIKFALDNDTMKGVYNCSSPGPVSNAAFMKELRNILKPIFYLPSPKILLEVGAIFINTETELILKSRWVIPKKLSDAGFVFQYPTIQQALSQILSEES